MKYLKRFTLVGLCAIVMFLSTKTNAQEFSAGINTETPNPNAVLHLVAPNGDQGLLIPSLTTAERTSMTLTAADNGLMVFDSEDNAFYFWVNPNWVLTTNTDNQNLTNVLGQGNDAGGASIENVADPVNPQDVATKNYVDNQGDSDDQDLELTGTTLSLTNDPTSIDLTPFLDNTDNQNLSSVLASGNDAGAIAITNLPTPTNPADAATKSYVDSNAGLTTVTSVDIVDGEIANADINAGANISWSKIDKTGANVSDFTNDLGFIDNAANPTALDVSGSFGTGLQVDQVGGATAGDIAAASAIVNGNPNLDLDSTDDLDLTTVPNGAGDIAGDFGTGLLVDFVGGANASDIAGATATVLGNPNLDLDSTDDLDLTTVPNAGGDIIGDFGSGLIIDANAVTSAEIQDGSIVDADVSDVGANKITYDNTTSLLSAIDVQAAIDEIDGTVDGIGTPAANVVTFNNVASGLTATDVQGAIDEIDGTIDAGDLTDDQTGAEVTFNNVASGLTATDVQGAIDEIDATVDGIGAPTAATTTFNNVASGLTATDVQGAIDEIDANIDAGDLTDDQTGAEVTFNNVASGLTATDVQGAIDEIDGTVDGLGTPAANVVTFNNVASGLTATDVQGAIDEIDATIDAGDLTDDQTGAEVTFNNVAAGLTATDVQGAIDEIDATIDAGDLTDDQTGAEVTFNNVASGLTATDVQGAIDEIDGTVDGLGTPAANVVTFNNVASGLTATDVQGAIDEIDATIDAGDLTDDQTGAEVTFNNVAAGLTATDVQGAIDEIDATIDAGDLTDDQTGAEVTFNNVASGLTATDVQGAIDEIDATIDAGDLTDDQTGAEVTFNNVASGLTSTDVQGAIDEIDATIDAGDLTDDQTGAEVTFNNVASGLTATDVQGAIDEIDGTVDGLGTPAANVVTFNNVASGLTATDVQGAIDEIDATIDAGDLTDDQTGAEVTFNNVASGLTATDVQGAIDEIDATIDAGDLTDDQTGAEVTFNNVASGLTSTDVQGAIDEIDATIDAGDLTDDQTGAEVTFNNVASGLTATDVQGAIDEIDATIDAGDLTDDQTGAEVTFNNVASGLTATDVQGAIDEIDGTVDGLGTPAANVVTFNNVASGLSAVNVQAAIDEIDGTVDGLGTAASTTFNNVASGLTATDVQGAIDEIDATIDAGDLTDDQTGAEVTFNNVASGLTATDVQGAIDEIDATIDAGDLTDDQTGAEVTFNNVASGLTATDVQGAIDEIDATIDAGDLTDDQTGAEVTFNNVASGLTATDVQGAIDEIDATIDAGDLTDDQTGAEVTFNNVASGLTATDVQGAIDEIDATIDAGDLTDDQDLSIAGNTIAISGDPNSDVDLAFSPPADGEVLTWDNTNTRWDALAVPVTGDMFAAVYDPGAVLGDAFDLSNHITFTPPADGEVLTWDNTNGRWDALAVPVTGDMFAAVYDPGAVLGDAFDLSNHITFTPPADGEVLTWDNTNGRWDALAVPVTGDMFAAVYDPGAVLGDAFDLSNHITFTPPADGEVLTWDNTNGRWDALAVPVTGDMFAAVYDPGAVLGDAFDLSNHITFTPPADGEVLTWDNTNGRWDALAVPVTGDMFAAVYDPGAVLGDAFDLSNHITFTPPADGEVLTWDNTNGRWDALAVPVTGDMFAAVYDPGAVLGDAFDLSNHITFTPPADGEVLTWDNTNGRWDALAVPVTGDMFAAVYDPGAVLGDAFDLSIHTSFTAPLDGDVLTWDNTNGRWDALAPSPVLNSGSGVTINSNNIDLGGILAGPTSITTGAGNDLTIDGAGQLFINTGVANFRSNTINLGDNAGDNVRVVGGITFDESTFDLNLDVTDQTVGLGTLIVPDLVGATETLAVISDIGNFIDGSENNLAGNSSASPSGSNNIIFGFNSGVSMTTGSDNIVIGSSADNTAATTGGNVSIGVSADGNGGDAIAIGNTAQADGVSSVAIGKNAIASAANTFIVGGTGVDALSVGIGTSIPAVTLDIAATDAIRVPVGITAERPATPADGMFRFNTTDGNFEGYVAGGWEQITGNPNFQMGFVEDPNSAVFGAGTILPVPAGKAIQVIDDGIGGGGMVAAATFNNDLITNRATLALASARGNTGGPAAVQGGDVIGEIVFNGHYGGVLTNFDKGAGIEAVAANNWTSGNTGADLIFITSPSVASVPTERMRITESGGVGIGTGTPVYDLHVYNTLDQAKTITVDAQGTQTGQLGAFILQTLGDGSTLVDQIGTNGWMIQGYGDAFSDATRQNDLSFGYYQGNVETSSILHLDGSGTVGIGTGDPLAPLQIGDNFGFAHFENATEGINGEAITNNLYPDYTNMTDNALVRMNADSSSMIFMDDGSISFMRIARLGDAGATATVDLTNTSAEISSWMELNDDGSVQVSGGEGNSIVNDGANVALKAGDGFGGGNGNGGLLILQPGLGTGTGNDGLIIADGDLQVANGRSLVLEDGAASDAVGFRAPGTVTSGVIWELPPADGSAGQVLSTSGGGSGILSWVTPAGFVTPTFDDSNNLIVGSTAGTDPMFSGLDYQLGVVSPSGGKAFLSAHSYGGIPELRLSRTNGTQGGELPVSIGEVLGEVVFTGREVNSGNYPISAVIRAESTDNFDELSAYGTDLVFISTTSGTISPVDAMRISGGFIGINNNAPNVELDVIGGAEITGNVDIGAGNIVLASAGGITATGQINANASSVTTAQYQISGVTVINGSSDFTANSLDVGSSSASITTGGDITHTGNYVTPPATAVAMSSLPGALPAGRIIRVNADGNITNILAGVDGQEIVLVCVVGGPNTIGTGGNVKLHQNTAMPMVAGASIHFVWIQQLGNWVEIGRSE
ncbi:beta strand repeat-containing protein [Ekhidna sp.]|uniref:beta strand repeat-containing protein n=1 Tax=Ekhidna sp. TaxID=2608089 RepID=UPI003BA892AE